MPEESTELTGREKFAIEWALQIYIEGLQKDIKRWEGDKAAEDCKVLLAAAESALIKTKSQSL
ncbi:hypothetical protein C2I18_01580 [Paenibacillus sp. PK3_47]|uniref:hypothetical protein n=1 Tax=Paenibacillus sp. PK3_47 TaxID=2072642 RepID=UPI00201D7262|nr:hypothetical protein [Paenibacillus sp. PK3_47]UQZ32353.1 hypothetical protein C2I18_01580 [Paenibacillus sp. PK3_47]